MKNLADNMPPRTRAGEIRIAREKLHLARRSEHRDWRITLLAWAGENRQRASTLPRNKQIEMF